mmetsp:Transcript_2060/g.6101  ORF Transcript_2060/g.6101 Transcript_2060/m.6101 type:complete len:242 (-) Transcript_2060:78-803(-)
MMEGPRPPPWPLSPISRDPWKWARLATLTTRDPGRMQCSSWLVSRKGPRWLGSRWPSFKGSGSPGSPITPALLMRTLSPVAELALATVLVKPRTLLTLHRSSIWHSQVPGRPRESSSAFASRQRARLLQPRTTCAPSFISPPATSLPMPLFPPVTTHSPPRGRDPPAGAPTIAARRQPTNHHLSMRLGYLGQAMQDPKPHYADSLPRRTVTTGWGWHSCSGSGFDTTSPLSLRVENNAQVR